MVENQTLFCGTTPVPLGSPSPQSSPIKGEEETVPADSGPPEAGTGVS